MGNRRKSRELAMQALFYIDICQNDPDKAIGLFNINFNLSKNTFPFFLKLVKGVVGAKPEINSIIESFSNNWKIFRMSHVDRNIMRIAVYELLYCHDIPSKVSINEAIDMGKKYGTEESGAFINGILDSIRISIEKKEIEIK